MKKTGNHVGCILRVVSDRCGEKNKTQRLKTRFNGISESTISKISNNFEELKNIINENNSLIEFLSFIKNKKDLKTVKENLELTLDYLKGKNQKKKIYLNNYKEIKEAIFVYSYINIEEFDLYKITSKHLEPEDKKEIFEDNFNYWTKWDRYYRTTREYFEDRHNNFLEDTQGMDYNDHEYEDILNIEGEENRDFKLFEFELKEKREKIKQNYNRERKIIFK